MEFKNLIGRSALFILTADIGPHRETFKVVGVDYGGVWVEHQSVTDLTHKELGEQALHKTPVMFIPYHRILSVFAESDKVSLSEKGFGL